jgi:predicted hotdog family 3-hydroxylacyl-ACP dehydratase
MYVRSVGFFAPGLRDVDAFAAGQGDPEVTSPRDVLPARARRGVSLVTRMLADVTRQAVERAGFAASSVRTVYASAFGETDAAVALLAMQHQGDGMLSPARFATSVHNTASGLVSIADGNRAFSTAIAGGPDTVAMGLLEAAALFHDEPMPLVVAFADEPVPAVLDARLGFRPLAVAFGLSERAEGALAAVVDLGRRARPSSPDLARGPGGDEAPTFANPIERALPLVRAVLGAGAAGAPVTVALDGNEANPWTATVAPAAFDPTRSEPLPPLTEVVPHRPPMLLLDQVTRWEPRRIACQVVLRDDSPFVEAGRAPATLAIEYMAQCIAAHVGMRGRASGEPVQIGYLIGARDVTLPTEDFRVGDVLRVTAAHLWGDDRLGSFTCTVERGGRAVAAGTLNVYRGRIEEDTPQ